MRSVADNDSGRADNSGQLGKVNYSDLMKSSWKHTLFVNTRLYAPLCNFKPNPIIWESNLNFTVLLSVNLRLTFSCRKVCTAISGLFLLVTVTYISRQIYLYLLSFFLLLFFSVSWLSYHIPFSLPSSHSFKS